MTRLSAAFCALAICVASFGFASHAHAGELQPILDQAAKDDKVQAQLVADAKKEGSVSFYTSIAADVTGPIKTAFEKKYGVTLNFWRADDRVVLQKFTTETQSGAPSADAINIGSLQMEMLHRAKALQPIDSPFRALVVPAVAPEHKDWIGTFIDVTLQGYNTDAIEKPDLPKTYQDLLDPKWKGKLGIEAKDVEWFYAIAQNMGEEKGLKFFKDLVATNGMSVRTGHSLLTNMVAAGDVPFGLDIFGHMAITAKKKGQPVDYVLLDPAVGMPFAMGIAAKAPHPHAALLFYQFMMTDGEQIFAERNYTPARTDIPTEFQHAHFTIVDDGKFLNTYDHWLKLYEDMIVKPAAKP